jgi:hypothetical protein
MMNIKDILELKQKQETALDYAIGVYVETHRKYRDGYKFNYHDEVATIRRAYVVLDLGGLQLYIRYGCFISSWHSPDDINEFNVLVPEFSICDIHGYIAVNRSLCATATKKLHYYLKCH